MLQKSGHEVKMIPLSHTAGLSSPKSHGVSGLPFGVMVLLALATVFACSAAAEELTISSSLSAKVGARPSRIEFNQRLPLVRVAIRSPRRRPAWMIIRSSKANEFIRIADARSDITSVRVASPSLSGESSEKEEDNFLARGNSSNVLLPGDTGRYADPQTASGVVVDGLASGAVATSEVAFSNDDFLGHIREFLQTKK